jgi:hypothetical protein
MEISQILVYGFALTFFIFLIVKSGHTYPIVYVFFFVFYVQYVFSTYLIYEQYETLEQQMPIGEEQLFEYLIPALFFFFLGVVIFNKDHNVLDLIKQVNGKSAANLGYLLVLISFGFEITRYAGLDAFKSILSFTYYLRFLGAFCFILAGSVTLYVFAALIYLQLAVMAITGGLFIDLIVWGIFFFFWLSLKFNISLTMRAVLFASSIPILIIIQSVKYDYRKSTWGRNKKGKASVELYTRLAVKSGTEGELFATNSSAVVKTVARLNQGWHLGMTLRQVPNRTAFANGNEMLTDITASLIPRFINPTKKTVHTKAKFRLYTGYNIRGNTSMTIGILGDFYINFGKAGSYIALFIFGAFISLFIRFFYWKYVFSDPVNIIWIPFILYYLVQADNEFYSFFNGLVKGFIIFLIVNFIRKSFFGESEAAESAKQNLK